MWTVLLAANADANQSTNDNGTGGDFVHTPLFKAASQNYSECVRLLLAANADVDQATIDEGATPLFIGCLRGSTECVRLLLAANADVDQALVDNNDATPMSIACAQGYAECAQLLSSYGASRGLFQEQLVGALVPGSSYVESMSTGTGHAALTEWLMESRRSLYVCACI